MESEQLYQLGFFAVAAIVLSAIVAGSLLWASWLAGRRRWNLCGDRCDELITRLPQPAPRWTAFDFFLMLGLVILIGSLLNQLGQNEVGKPDATVEDDVSAETREEASAGIGPVSDSVTLHDLAGSSASRIAFQQPSAETDQEAESGVPGDSAAGSGAAVGESDAEPATHAEADGDQGEPGIEQAPAEPRDKLRLIQISCLANVAAMLITIAFLFFVHRVPLKNLSLFPCLSDIRRGTVATVWILAPVLLVNFVVAQLVEYEHTVMDVLGRDHDPKTFLFLLFSAALVTPFAEEFMFRLLLQGGLQRLADPPVEDQPYRPVTAWPVVVTSLVFALMHSGQGAAPVPLFVLSLGLGFLYQRTGRLGACIVVHMLLNAATLCLEFCRVGAGL